MKNGKRPTRRQKQAIESVNLKASDWLVFKTEPYQIHIVHHLSKTTRTIPI